MAYDLKIIGGTIIDGSGGAGYRGDVGIVDGRIVALGDAPDHAAKPFANVLARLLRDGPSENRHRTRPHPSAG